MTTRGRAGVPRPEGGAGSSTRARGNDRAGPDRGQVGLRSLARGSTANIVGAASMAVANVAVVVAVTRGVGQAQAGAFFAATSAFVLGSMAAKLGTPTALVYFVSRLRALGAPGQVRRCLAIALTPVTATAVLLAVLLVVFAPQAARVFADGGAGAVAYIRAVAVFLPVAAASDAFLAATRGFGSMRPTVLVENIGRPLAQLVFVGCAVVTGSTGLLTVAWAGPYAPAAAMGLLWLTAMWHAGRSRQQPAAGNGGEPAAGREVSPGRFWRYSLPRALGSITQVAMQRLDILLVAALRGPVEAAVYTAATRFLVVGQLTNRAISLAVQPRLGALLAVDGHGAANRIYQTSTAWLVLLACPLYLLFAVFAGQVMRVFGDGYGSGAPVVVILALTMLLATGCGMVEVVLNMAGRTTWTLATSLLALAVNVGLDLLLIPTYGIIGAAIGWAVALAVKNLASLALLAWRLRLHPFGAGTVTGLALSGACFGLLPVAAWFSFGGTPVALVAGSLLGAAVYAYGCWHRREVLALATAARALAPGASARRDG